MMSDFRENSELMNWPWIESPFYESLSFRETCTPEFDHEKYRIADVFHEYGYIILDLGLSDDELSLMRNEIDLLNLKENIKTQENAYHYSKGKRIFEAWKDNEILRNLSLNEKILDTLRFLYKREPYPFQTITFDYGSNQPLHSDVIHFDSIPHRWLTAAWIALEKMTTKNGSLLVVPGSHRLPFFNFYDLKIEVPEYGEQFDSYAKYDY